jgi:hypothetical protein
MGCGAFEGMTALLLKRPLRCFGHLLVDFLTVFGCAFASAFRFAAHRWCILSAAASRWAGESLRRFLFAGAGAEAEMAFASGFFGGRHFLEDGLYAWSVRTEAHVLRVINEAGSIPAGDSDDTILHGPSEL